MVHSYGYKSGTRHMFQKQFRKHGMPTIARKLQTFRVGDYVDVVADPAVRKGMPHKDYHGKTGIVWNVTPRGVGVIVNKKVRVRTLRKRICVRAEHVRPSKCNEQFKARLAAYREFVALKKAGKTESKAVTSSRGAKIVKVKKGMRKNLKRSPEEFDAFLPY